MRRVGDRSAPRYFVPTHPQPSPPLPPEAMVVSLVNGGSGSSEPGPGAGVLSSVLACYLCGELYRKPRILPCGHTFCSDCLARQREFTIREARLSSSLDRRQGPHEGGHRGGWDRRQHTPDYSHGLGSLDSKSHSSESCFFYCPVPECNYSLRVMNLTRWTTRNKVVSETVSAFRRQQAQKQDASTQTDLKLDSILVAIPRSLVSRARHASERHGHPTNEGSFVDNVMHRALSMDSVSRNYIPQGHFNWRSAVAMIGFNVLQQIINI